jgi:hypothetical protein
MMTGTSLTLQRGDKDPLSSQETVTTIPLYINPDAQSSYQKILQILDQVCPTSNRL